MVTIVFGVLFMFVLGFQTPRQGRGLQVERNGECQPPDPCAAGEVAVFKDPAQIFDSITTDSAVVDSGGSPAPLERVRA